MTDRFPDMKIYLWRQFWGVLCRRHPDYALACDTLRLIEGEEFRIYGKILPFKRRQTCEHFETQLRSSQAS